MLGSQQYPSKSVLFYWIQCNYSYICSMSLGGGFSQAVNDAVDEAVASVIGHIRHNTACSYRAYN